MVVGSFLDNETYYFNFSSTLEKITTRPKYDNDLEFSRDLPPYEVDKVFCHPMSDDYLVFLTDSDVALVKLKNRIPVGKPPYYFEKIGFYRKDLNPRKGYMITVAGWGQIELEEKDYEDRTDFRLRKANMPIRKFSGIHEFYRPKQQIVVYKENVSTCFGDSGSPAVITKNGKQYLVGIVSYGVGTRCE